MPRSCSPASSGDPSPYVAADPAADAPATPTSPSAAPGPTRCAPSCSCAGCASPASRCVGDPVAADGPEPDAALDLHAGVAELIDGARRRRDGDPRSESASRAALAIALVRSAKAAFDAHGRRPAARRRPGPARPHRAALPPDRRRHGRGGRGGQPARPAACRPSALLVDTLGTLAGVLADLELMPLALDYQRRAARGRPRPRPPTPARLGPDDGDPDVLVAVDRHLARRALRRAGRGAARRRRARVGRPATSPRPARLAEQALALLPAGVPGRRRPRRSCTAGRWSGWASTPPRSGRCAPPSASPRPPPTGRSWPRRGWRWAGRCAGRATARAADEHLVAALTLATEHGLPRLRRAALRELCTLHAELDDAGSALPYLQAYLSDELDRVDERRTRWVELFGRRKSLLETERAAGQLRRQAYEDPLTHLPNRRYAEARLDGLLSAGVGAGAGRRRRRPVQVDQRRDRAPRRRRRPARRSAELLVAGVRDTDEVCRWAGDEFVILLPDTTAEQAERALERIRRSVARLRLVGPRPGRPGHHQRRHRLGRPRRRPPHAVRRRRRRALRRQAQRPRPRRAAVRGDPDPRRRQPARRPVRRRRGAAPDTAPATAGAADAAIRSPTCSLPRWTTSPHRTRRPTASLRCLVEPRRRRPAAGPRHARRAAARPAAGASPAGAAGPPRRPSRAVRPRRCRAASGRLAVEPEVIWGTGRSTEQILALVREARREHPDRPALVLRATAETLVAAGQRARRVHDHGRRRDGRRRRPDARAGRPGRACCAPAAATPPSPPRPPSSPGSPAPRWSGSTTSAAAGSARCSPTAALLADVDCLVVVAGLDASLASDDRRADRRPGRRGADVDRAAQRVRRPRRADDDAQLGRAGRRR